LIRVNMKHVIYIVDDEPDIVEMISFHLERSGFSALGFSNSHELLKALQKSIPSLIILDLMLPDEDGIETCKRLKKDGRLSHVPVIMVTARGEESDKVLGLEVGADDYITKPFSPNELIARVRAILRRYKNGEDKNILPIAHDFIIDVEKHETYVSGEKVDLTVTEFRILSLLASKAGVVFSREQILEHLWGNEKMVIDRTIDMHIKNMRKKLQGASRYIKNIRGIGYKVET
jgi:DNA-binding response OmpR family regulator